MPPRTARALWLAAPLLYFLFFFRLAGTGMLGPDEPRYAAVAREMARSGDWITPRLWGEPWFEKPALLYWMTAAGFKAGLNEDLAPRVPVAIVSVAFLAFLFIRLRREFDETAAFYATAMLATSAMWLGYSHVAVTDLPLAAAWSAAMLLALPWIKSGERRTLPAMAALLGVAVLAKGLVPLVLSLPLVWFGRKRLFDLLRPQVAGVFLLVAAPWYALCWWRNGWPFLEDFFLVHQLGRFTSDALQHEQPFWFYLPVIAGALVPWTPLAALALRRSRDPRRQFLLASAAFGFVFLSASTNKLPGYILPLLPPLCVLAGVALAERRRAPLLFAAGALLLALIPPAGQLLPAALADGLSRAPVPRFSWIWLLPVPLAYAVWRLRTHAAAIALTLSAAAGAIYLKATALPAIDAAVSARPLWRKIEGRGAQVCVGEIHRAWRYGLNYYSIVPLPDCEAVPRPFELRGAPPELTAPPPSR
ncbi:MAG: ArnT family glycosyltransferase [Bryobacteraceae bacterium]